MKSQNKCKRCNRAFTDGAPVIAVERYTVNSKVDRGHGVIGYVHMTCPPLLSEEA